MLKRTGLIVFVFMIPAIFGDCSKNPQSRPVLHKPDSRHFLYTGRIDFTDPGKPRLSSAGAYIQARFLGSACSILLEDQNLNNNHNYISVVIDGEYLGRVKISRDIVEYPLVSGLPDREHTLQVIKATESQIGYIDFLGLICEWISPVEDNLKRKIEFIGNSITCGMGLEMSGIPCDSGEWYDQHNAYLAYGPKAAGELHADWLLSSVSGIGITRNWNSQGPTMPQVYANTFLDTNPQLIWDRDSYVPDLVSVCLGTNDFSDGDGSYDRAELDSAQFVNDYIRFIQFIRDRYPGARICCLSSPMFSGEKGDRLIRYISEAVRHVQSSGKDDQIHLFVFSRSYTNGCSVHPGMEDHQRMTEELVPFFRKVMNW